MNKKYMEFLELLNKNKVDWCLIKDYDLLVEKGYDNEIDIITEENNREIIRKLGKKLEWNESSLNKINTHLIFWSFEGETPYRIDVHLGKALATAVPWLTSSEIISDKVKKGKIFTVSEKYELALLIIGSLRGRAPKEHRIKKARELREYLPEAKMILKKHLNSEEVDNYYDKLINGKIVSLSKHKRLGISGILKEKLLLNRLLIIRSLKPSPEFYIYCENTEYKEKVLKRLMEILNYSKLKVILLKKNSFLSRLFYDFIIIDSNTKKGIILDDTESVSESLKKILFEIHSGMCQPLDARK